MESFNNKGTLMGPDAQAQAKAQGMQALIASIIAASQKPSHSRQEFIKRFGQLRPEVQQKLKGEAVDGEYKLADTSLYTKVFIAEGTNRIDLVKTGVSEKIGIRSFDTSGRVDNNTSMVVTKLFVRGGTASAGTDAALLAADLQEISAVTGLESVINGELTIQVDNNYVVYKMPMSTFLTKANGEGLLRDGEYILDNPFEIHPQSTIKAEIVLEDGTSIVEFNFLHLEFKGSGTLRR